ncbi:hypothetical protein ACS0PU_011862 [Formica fusca]
MTALERRCSVSRVGDRDSIRDRRDAYAQIPLYMYTCLYIRVYKLYLYYPANFTRHSMARHATPRHANATGCGYKVSKISETSSQCKFRGEKRGTAREIYLL